LLNFWGGSFFCLQKNNLNSSIWQRRPNKHGYDYWFCKHMWVEVIGNMCEECDVVEGHKIFSQLWIHITNRMQIVKCNQSMQSIVLYTIGFFNEWMFLFCGFAWLHYQV
jgi:hypothetical protein